MNINFLNLKFIGGKNYENNGFIKKFTKKEERRIRQNKVKVRILISLEIVSILAIIYGILSATILAINFITGKVSALLIICGLLGWNIFDAIMDILVDEDCLPWVKKVDNAIKDLKAHSGIKLRSGEDA